MRHEPEVMDIRTVPEIARVAREVATSGRPRILRDDGMDVAMILPVRQPRRPRSKSPTAEEWEAVEALFGAWRDEIDPDEFKRQRGELQLDDRPADAVSPTVGPPKHSIMELRGLGREIWEGVDAQEYVNDLRGEWGRPMDEA